MPSDFDSDLAGPGSVYPISSPEVETSDDTSYNISDTFAILGGNVLSSGAEDPENIIRGIIISKAHDSNDMLKLGTGNNEGEYPMGFGLYAFWGKIRNLAPDILYYYRAFAMSDLITGYGDVKSFTTLGINSNPPYIENAKAIIVAGGGPSTETWRNNIWEHTLICANYAYRSLQYQGYRNEDIYYLNHVDVDVDYDGVYDNDNDATIGNLYYAINTWARDEENHADELLVYMVDHGGIGTFRMRHDETLYASDLDDWLDELQQTMEGKFIVIYEACRSGTFASLLDPPPEKERIILISASDENAFLLKNGRHSFSYMFWASIFGGYLLKDSFTFAQDMMVDYQTAALDVNGNGILNEKEDLTLVSQVAIGIGKSVSSDMPLIENATVSESSDDITILNLEVSSVTDNDNIAEVWVVIIPPCFDPDGPDGPITDLPTVILQKNADDSSYKGISNIFIQKGVYRINFYASDMQGFYSLPVSKTIEKMNGISCIKGDVNGDGMVNMTDLIIALKIVCYPSFSNEIRADYTESNTDINRDNLVGLEEAVFLLRTLSNI